MASRVSDLLDAVIVIDDFERAEVEFANVRGGERIFPSAFAAFQRLHETICLSINVSQLRSWPSVGACLLWQKPSGPIKKPLLMG